MQKKPFHSDRRDRQDKPFKKFHSDEKPNWKNKENREARGYDKKGPHGGGRAQDASDRERDRKFDKGRDGYKGKPFNRDKREEKGEWKAVDKPFKKFDKEKPFRNKPEAGDRPNKRAWSDGESKGAFHGNRRNNATDERKGAPEEKRKPNRYSNTFGRFDDKELVSHLKKEKARKEKAELGDEITFSKELENKWAQEEVQRTFGKSDVGPKGKRDEGAAPKDRKRNVIKDKFKRHFDSENVFEKAYSSMPDSRAKEAAAPPAQEPKSDLMPLNKYIAHCGVCSRRDAVELIKEGRVTVNGESINEPGHKVTLTDEINLDGKKLILQNNLVYILMNKPKGFITTTDDPKGRRTVMELVENHIEERVFPVGRLDRNTTGLLLLTNDGELAQKLSHPKYEVRKVYKVTLERPVSLEDFDRIRKGIVLEDGPVNVDQIEYLDERNEIGLEIHSGKNRIVRRIFESLGYVVEKLDRVMYAGLTKKTVLRGKWRFLTKQEVVTLKHIL